MEREYHYLENMSDLESTEEESKEKQSQRRKVFAIVEFDRPVPVVPKCKGWYRNAVMFFKILSMQI